jgi:hypothetical protein
MALLDFPSGPSVGQSTTQNGNTWKWNGTSWVAFNNVSLTSQVTGILAVDYGGTGFGGTYTAGDILYALSSNTFGKLNAGTAGSVLASGGPSTAPYWKKDDAGTGSVSAGTLGGFAYYDTSNSITSGTAVSYIIGSGAGGTGATFVIKQSTMALIGSTITAGTWAGSAITLAYGGTNNTISGVGHSYRVAMFDAAGTAITNISSAGTANSVLFQSGQTVSPTWVGQNTLVVGGATTAANIQGGTQYNVVYQSNANTTGFVGNAAGSGASVLTQTGNAAPVYFGQSQLVVGGASTAANIQGGTQYNVVYQSNANTTGFVGNAAGSGASILTQTGNAAPVYFGQSQLVVGGATTSANIQGGSTGNIHYQTGSNTTGFVGNAAGSGASVLTQNGNNAPVYFGQSQLVVGGASTAANIQGGGIGQIAYNSAANTTSFLSHPGAGYALTSVGTGTSVAWQLISNLAVTSVSPGTAIQVSANTGAVTITNNGVHSVTGTTNRINISASTGGTGAVTVTLPNTVVVNEIQVDGPSSTLATVGSQPTSMVNKQYVDNLASGLDIHDSVRLVITSAIGASYYQPGYGIGNTATGAYLTSIGNSTFPQFDGVTIGSTGILQRVLVTGGLTATGKTSINGSALVTPATLADSYLVNGIYYLGSVGSGSSQWYLYRAAETDDNTELTGGTFTFVEEGTTFKDTGWVCTNDTTNLGPIQFGSTAISFSQFTGAAAISFGQGLTRVGNTVAANVNLSATGAASGTGYSQFNIGGPSVGGAADTGYYPTFSVRTSGTTVSGSALLTLNSDGFSLVGSTSTNRTITVTGSDITLTGGGNTLTLTGSISLPAPSQYRLAYGSSSTALGFLTAGTASSVLFQTNNSTDPAWVGQNTLVVGGATTAANIQGGALGNIHYQTGSNTTGFVTNAAGSGSSILTQAGNAAPVFLGQSQLVVGGATTSANIQGGTQYNVVYQSNANTTGFVGNAAGSGASVLTQTGNAVPVYFGQSQLVVGGATTSANIQGGSLGNIHYQTGSNTTGFVGNAAGSGASVLTQTGNAAPVYFGQSQLVVGGATTAANIQGGTQYNVVYQSNANTTGFVGNAAGSGASVLTQTGSAAPVYLGQSQLSVGSATNSTNVNVTAVTGTGASYLAFVSGTSGNLPIYVDSNITVDASSNTITANLTGTATTATRVGITTTVTDGNLPIVFASDHQPSAALGSSTLLTYNPSNGKITNGIWAGTAITTGRGGTGLLSVSANQILMGASTGSTWAAVGSSVVPVVAIGAAAPAKPGGAIGDTQAGQLWWDSEYGVLKVYYVDATPTAQWVDATPVLGSSGGGSSTKRSYVMTFGAGFTPSTGADTVQIQIPYAPDNSSKYYYIKRLDYRNESVSSGAGVSFYIERYTGTGAFNIATSGNRIHSGAGLSFVAAAGIYITSYTLSSTGASFVSSAGVAGSVISGDYLRLNFAAINSAATMSVSMVIEEQ